jgi:flagellar biosynthesis protein FlhG
VTRSNFYAVLGLDPGATTEQIEKAFRYLTDLYADDALATYSLLDLAEARKIRAQLREAYDVLKDPVRRLEYDVRYGLIVAPAAEPPAESERAGAASSEAPVWSPPEPRRVVPAPMTPRLRADPTVLAEPVTGAALREFRSQRGISLREIADTTKVGLRYLEYIESDRHEYLPAPVYLRGFLQEYAKAVGLDPRRTAEAYLATCVHKDALG